MAILRYQILPDSFLHAVKFHLESMKFLKIKIDKIVSKIYMKMWRDKISQDNIEEDKV